MSTHTDPLLNQEQNHQLKDLQKKHKRLQWGTAALGCLLVLSGVGTICTLSKVNNLQAQQDERYSNITNQIYQIQNEDNTRQQLASGSYENLLDNLSVVQMQQKASQAIARSTVTGLTGSNIFYGNGGSAEQAIATYPDFMVF